MSTNKNAYEIRADILKEATGLVTHKYEKDMYTRNHSIMYTSHTYSTFQKDRTKDSSTHNQ